MLYFKFEFDPTNKIMYKFYYGSISLQLITQSWDFAISGKLIPEQTVGFILDYRQANFVVEIGQLDQIATYYRLHPETFEGKRIAIVTESSKDVVVPILVSEKDFGYQSRPFSTMDSAIKWVLNR